MNIGKGRKIKMNLVASKTIHFFVASLSFILKNSNVVAFSLPSTCLSQQSQRRHFTCSYPFVKSTSLLELQSSSSTQVEVKSNVMPSAEWELDCYSRPVLIDGKKLWEVLITDSTGKFRVCEALPSNRVNSRELRKVVEEAIEKAEVKPNTIRFFRGAMFNMINIALSEVEVVARPSRCTFALASWLEERNRDVYPQMEG